MQEQLTFEAWVPIEKAGEDSNGDILISGPVADHVKDYDGDIIEKAAVWQGLEMHDKLGAQVDWDHLWAKTHDPDVLIGKGISRTLVNDVPWLTTKLRKGLPLVDKILRMHKDGMKLGYSIQGSGLRDPNDNKRIIKTNITMVTLAPQPKGFEQFIRLGAAPPGLTAIAKAMVTDDVTAIGARWEPIEYSLTTGSGVVQVGSTGGQALRQQSMLKDVPSMSFGDTREKKMKSIEDKEDVDPETDEELDDNDGDAGDDDGMDDDDMEKAMTADDFAVLFESEIAKAVEPLREQIEALAELVTASQALLEKSLSHTKIVNDNIIELGDQTNDIITFTKSLTAGAAGNPMIKSVNSDEDMRARTTPAPKKQIIRDEQLEKGVSKTVNTDEVIELMKAADAIQQRKGEVLPELSALADVLHHPAVDKAPLIAALRKAVDEAK